MPRLEFLPVQSLVIHERHDDQRTLPLIKRIRASGVFRNPPVVAPLQDGTERFMVLDGANRITALREMGAPDALVQVVEPDDPGLQLENWNHVVWELDPRRFLHGIQQVPQLHLDPTQEKDPCPNLTNECGLTYIQLPSQETYVACCDSSAHMVERVNLLNGIVDSYCFNARLDRTSVRSVRALIDIYPRLSGLVIFPHFAIRDLLRLAGDGYLLPSGITRFTISPRALHLNYPLDELFAPKPIVEKNQALEKWVQDCLARKRVRYYAEATFLFDE
jgi:hypothetical protein